MRHDPKKILSKKEPDDWFEEDQQSLDEHGRMNDIQSLDVLLIPENTDRGYSEKNALYRL